MALPPPFRPWLTVVCVLPVLMDQIPGVLQKCIYDEVQAEVRKVRLEPATSQGRGFYSQRLETNPRVGASPQPIRIHTWITRESDNLPEAERRRVMMAVEEGVDKVSSLLSGQSRRHCVTVNSQWCLTVFMSHVKTHSHTLLLTTNHANHANTV